MRTLIVIFFVGLMLALVAFKPYLPKDEKGKKTYAGVWTVQKSSSLRITGATNVNKFGCDIKGYYQNDTIFAGEEHPISKLVNLSGSLEINILKFDCHNKVMTSDLRKLLKARDHPDLKIRFLSLERNPVLANTKDALRGWVEITLAGVSKKFEVNYTFLKTDKSLIQLVGTRDFAFADFNLVAPTKFGGMVKVKDKFSVDFTLQLDPVNG